MESLTTPPSRRSEPRLRAKPTAVLCLDGVDDDEGHHHHHQHCPNLRSRSPISASPLHLPVREEDHVPLRELLLLSPSPARRSRHRHLHMENVDPNVVADAEGTSPRRRSKSRGVAGNVGPVTGCASPRHGRRSRRRLEREICREDREFLLGGFEEDGGGKVRRQRRQSRAAPRARKDEERLSLVVAPVAAKPLPPSPAKSVLSSEINNEDDRSGLEGVFELVLELVMWKDVAKSSLWFGLGSLCFLSSCFSRNLSFSLVSALSHLGLFILALAFFYDSFSQRYENKRQRQLKLEEDDVLRAVRLVLPTANAAIAVAQRIFSGEPSMTLKVAPVLLFAARYGHLITLWRLCAIGFFTSFTAPKLYSCYSHQVQNLVEKMKSRVSEAWKTCHHKRFVAISVGTVFWNSFGVKTRILAAFIAVVILRYHHQRSERQEEEEEKEEEVDVEDRADVKEGELVVPGEEGSNRKKEC